MPAYGRLDLVARLSKAFLMSTHNICFHGENKKSIDPFHLKKYQKCFRQTKLLRLHRNMTINGYFLYFTYTFLF